MVREDEDKTTDIWRMDRDGSNARRLVDCQAPCEYAENPAWSPDGTRIAYWTQGPTSTTQDIRIVDADNGKVVLAVTAPEYEAPINPRWSPDGTQIAVNVEHFLPGAANPDGSAIGVIDLRATRAAIQLLTAFALQASYPAWSPDGSHLAFTAGNLDPIAHPERGPGDLLSMRPDGSGLTRLTHQRTGQPLIVGPDWAADDLILVTLVRSSDDYNLATIRADGTELTDLVDPNTGVADPGGAHPRWSPTAT